MRFAFSLVVVLASLATGARAVQADSNPAGLGTEPGWKLLRGAVGPRPTALKAAGATGHYPGSPWTIERLIAQRALNPSRFDRANPWLGPILERDARLRAGSVDTGTLHGLVADTPYIRYLKFRRSLNPQRFDTFHLIMGPILAEDERIRNRPRPVPPAPEIILPPAPTPTPPPGVGSGDGEGPGPNPLPPPDFNPGVPEPSALASLLVGALAIGAARVARRRCLRSPLRSGGEG